MHRADIVGDSEFAIAVAASATLRRAIGTTTEHAWGNRAIELRDCHHHCRFKRQQAHFASAPLLQRLELDWMGGYIRHVQASQRFNRCINVIIGRTTDEREARQVEDDVNARCAVLHEKGVNGGARVQAAGESGNDLKALRFQSFDHAIIMAGVLAEQIRAQHKQSDGASGILDRRQQACICSQTCWQIGVINADLWIFARCMGGQIAL